MKFPVYIMSALALALLVSACASFEKGVPQQVVIVSFPSEASIYIDGIATGITPLIVDLPRKVSHEIRLEKQGYNTGLNISLQCRMTRIRTLSVSA